MELAVIMGFIVTVIILSLGVKGKNPEISMLIGMALCLFIIALSIDRLSSVMGLLKRISEYISVDNTYLAVLLKLLGVSYVCEFAAGISKDAGYSAVAAQIELTGKLTMLVISMPVVLSVIDKVVNLIG